MNTDTPTLPLDVQLAAIVAALRAAGAPSPFEISPEAARERMRKGVLAARAARLPPQVGSVEDRYTDGPQLVPLRVYRPVQLQHPMPTTLFFHGGGFVLGSVELADDIARELCRDLQAVVVSVDYRLAPEHPFPAAHDDALEAALWVLRHVEDLGGDKERIGIAGESAGANLAASTALTLRDRGLHLAAQLLVVPGVDLGRDLAPIAARGRDTPMLSVTDLATIAHLYIGTTPEQAQRFPASPLRAASLAGAPPAVVAVTGHDPLREEGLAYAGRLRAAGVLVELLEFTDMFHPFLGFLASSDAARRAAETAFKAFSLLLRRPGALIHSTT
jgi:acetyl esterase